MTDTQYYYAVARIRSKELSLLSSSFLEQLLGAKTLDEALRLLHVELVRLQQWVVHKGLKVCIVFDE